MSVTVFIHTYPVNSHQVPNAVQLITVDGSAMYDMLLLCVIVDSKFSIALLHHI
jgi:hypothetical protein